MRDVKPIISQLFTNQELPICMAPMVGLTNGVFRKIVKDYLPQQVRNLWPTEMLNSRRLPKEILGKSTETFVFPDETDLVPQILGNDFEAISLSVQKLNQNWNLSAIDINMGCPVQKALKHNYGVALMGDADYAAQVVKWAVAASNGLPVSVKLRSVEKSQSQDEFLNFINGLVEAGASWLTLHPRPASQQRRGKADWQELKKLKLGLPIPLIGNGDIQTAEDVFQMLEETGVDKVMSGRALTARPWLMAQVYKKLYPGVTLAQIIPETALEEGAEYGQMLLKLIKLYDEIYFRQLKLPEALVLRKIQFFVKTGQVWLEYGHALMSEVNKSKTLEELTERVDKFFRNEQVMFSRTDLRQ